MNEGEKTHFKKISRFLLKRCQRNKKKKSKEKQTKRGKDFGLNKHKKKQTESKTP